VTAAPAPTRAFVVSHTLGCSVLWASSFLFMKLSAAMGPFALGLLPRDDRCGSHRGLLRAAGSRASCPRGAEWRHWLVLGTLNGWGPNVLVAYALTQIATGTAAMIQAASPLVVAVIAHLMFAEERLSPIRLAGVFVGFVGNGHPDRDRRPCRTAASAPGLSRWSPSRQLRLGNIYARSRRETSPARLGFGQQVCSGSARPF
jgi:multidrug transporter EmrE-like cation transporter